MSKTVDLWVLYRIISRLATPFDETEAYELGIIDKKGKLQKKPKSKEEKEAYAPFDRFVFNLKRLLHKAGVRSKFATYTAALFLLKESDNIEDRCDDLQYIEENLLVELNDMKNFKEYQEFLNEEVPANATGSAVAGTGNDVMHWVKQQRRKKHGKPINGLAFLRRRRQQERKKYETKQ